MNINPDEVIHILHYKELVKKYNDVERYTNSHFVPMKYISTMSIKTLPTQTQA